MVKASGILKWQVLILLILFIVFFIFKEAMHSKLLNNLVEVFSLSKGGVTKPVRYKCDLSKPCPEGHFAFKIHSGIASVLGPKLCLEDSILMSGVMNNIGQGMNVALVDGETGQLIKTEVFNTWAGDVSMLIKFLKTIEDGTLVMMATFDDASTKLNAEARQLISNLGSLRIQLLGLRDNWVFVGRKGMSNQTSFEKYIKNDVGTNRYDGWPDFVEMEGCVGQGLDKSSENN